MCVLGLEVELLWRVKHPNLVGLVGYCKESGKEQLFLCAIVCYNCRLCMQVCMYIYIYRCNRICPNWPGLSIFNLSCACSWLRNQLFWLKKKKKLLTLGLNDLWPYLSANRPNREKIFLFLRVIISFFKVVSHNSAFAYLPASAKLDLISFQEMVWVTSNKCLKMWVINHRN